MDKNKTSIGVLVYVDLWNNFFINHINPFRLFDDLDNRVKSVQAM